MPFSATAVEPEWDPHDPSFLDQEDALLTTGGFLRERPEEFRGWVVEGMHANPCKSLQECGDGNLEHVLTAHIILSSVWVQASTRMQPKYPTDLAEKWGGWIVSVTLHIGVKNSEETSYSAPYLFELPFPN